LGSLAVRALSALEGGADLRVVVALGISLARKASARTAPAKRSHSCGVKGCAFIQLIVLRQRDRTASAGRGYSTEWPSRSVRSIGSLAPRGLPETDGCAVVNTFGVCGYSRRRSAEYDDSTSVVCRRMGVPRRARCNCSGGLLRTGRICKPSPLAAGVTTLSSCCLLRRGNLRPRSLYRLRSARAPVACKVWLASARHRRHHLRYRYAYGWPRQLGTPCLRLMQYSWIYHSRSGIDCRRCSRPASRLQGAGMSCLRSVSGCWSQGTGERPSGAWQLRRSSRSCSRRLGMRRGHTAIGLMSTRRKLMGGVGLHLSG
jgi:hypothetical protein